MSGRVDYRALHGMAFVFRLQLLSGMYLGSGHQCLTRDGIDVGMVYAMHASDSLEYLMCDLWKDSAQPAQSLRFELSERLNKSARSVSSSAVNM